MSDGHECSIRHASDAVPSVGLLSAFLSDRGSNMGKVAFISVAIAALAAMLGERVVNFR